MRSSRSISAQEAESRRPYTRRASGRRAGDGVEQQISEAQRWREELARRKVLPPAEGRLHESEQRAREAEERPSRSSRTGGVMRRVRGSAEAARAGARRGRAASGRDRRSRRARASDQCSGLRRCASRCSELEGQRLKPRRGMSLDAIVLRRARPSEATRVREVADAQRNEGR